MHPQPRHDFEVPVQSRLPWGKLTKIYTCENAIEPWVEKRTGSDFVDLNGDCRRCPWTSWRRNSNIQTNGRNVLTIIRNVHQHVQETCTEAPPRKRLRCSSTPKTIPTWRSRRCALGHTTQWGFRQSHRRPRWLAPCLEDRTPTCSRHDASSNPSNQSCVRGSSMMLSNGWTIVTPTESMWLTTQSTLTISNCWGHTNILGKGMEELSMAFQSLHFDPTFVHFLTH